MDTEDLGWRGPAAVLVVVVVVLVGALVFMGGQTSTILSNVGNAVGTGIEGGDPASGQQDVGTAVDAPSTKGNRSPMPPAQRRRRSC